MNRTSYLGEMSVSVLCGSRVVAGCSVSSTPVLYDSRAVMGYSVFSTPVLCGSEVVTGCGVSTKPRKTILRPSLLCDIFVSTLVLLGGS